LKLDLWNNLFIVIVKNVISINYYWDCYFDNNIKDIGAKYIVLALSKLI